MWKHLHGAYSCAELVMVQMPNLEVHKVIQNLEDRTARSNANGLLAYQELLGQPEG